MCASKGIAGTSVPPFPPHLLNPVLVLFELLGVREGNGIHTLQALLLGIAAPVSTIAGVDANSLHSKGVWVQEPGSRHTDKVLLFCLTMPAGKR